MLPAGFNESYAADGLNRYTSARGATPSYDGRGNMTSDGSMTYGYDYDNRLTSAYGGVSLAYDPAGRLHQVSGASTTRFLYDSAGVIAEYDASGSVLRRYVHGPSADEPLVWYEGSGTNDRRYLVADERGSVIGISNSSGTITQIDKYDAYGVPDSANQGRFQYTGQMWIPELGLYHYKARAYHPRLGRFMQADPIGIAGGTNLYGYVNNDPPNFRDPTGNYKVCSSGHTTGPPRDDSTASENVFTWQYSAGSCSDVPVPFGIVFLYVDGGSLGRYNIPNGCGGYVPDGCSGRGSSDGTNTKTDIPFFPDRDGNWDDIFNKQDNRCSVPIVGGLMDLSPSIRACCIAHDNGMAAIPCNASSWRTTTMTTFSYFYDFVYAIEAAFATQGLAGEYISRLMPRIPVVSPGTACDANNRRAAVCVIDALTPATLP